MAVAFTLVGCGGFGLLPRQTDVKNTSFRSYEAVQAAYRTIDPGSTKEADLGQVGFDASQSPNVEILSYLGVIEKFMPRDSIKFDELDPAVRNCIEARGGCSAYVFRLANMHRERTGNWLLDVLGFKRTTMTQGWSAEVMLLVQDERVVYKVISGRPHIQDFDDNVQPLGPLQDLGGTVLHTASRVSAF
jgi:hypothetical protein